MIVLSILPSLALFGFGVFVYENERAYWMGLATFPVGATFVLLHYFLTIENKEASLERITAEASFYTREYWTKAKIVVGVHHLVWWLCYFFLSIPAYFHLYGRAPFGEITICIFASHPACVCILKVRTAMLANNVRRDTVLQFIEDTVSLFMRGMVFILYGAMGTIGCYVHATESELYGDDDEGKEDSHDGHDGCRTKWIANRMMGDYIMALFFAKLALVDTGCVDLHTLLWFDATRPMQVVLVALSLGAVSVLFMEAIKDQESDKVAATSDLVFYINIAIIGTLVSAMGYGLPLNSAIEGLYKHLTLALSNAICL